MSDIFASVLDDDLARDTRSMESFFVRLLRCQFHCFHLKFSLMSNAIRPHNAINDLLIMLNAIIHMILGLMDTLVSTSNTVFDLLVLSAFVLLLLVMPKLSLIEFVVLSRYHRSHVLHLHLVVHFLGWSMLFCWLFSCLLDLFFLEFPYGANSRSFLVKLLRSTSAIAAGS